MLQKSPSIQVPGYSTHISHSHTHTHTPRVLDLDWVPLEDESETKFQVQVVCLEGAGTTNREVWK